VLLIGFMGAGKSTVSRILAERLGRATIDLDDRIAEKAGRSVTQIFEAEGEESFRELETQALATLADEAPCVVACGGGVVMRPQNRALLRDLGVVVYLAVSVGEALARIGDATTRPLLAGSGGTLAATTLLEARETLYRSVADVTVDTVGRDAVHVADAVCAALEGECV
jgi:shikimate kinase